ncbi:MAG: lipoate--protein ligase family protein [Actinobacteria bacterium]|nr:lipoate--protein ligase family protein [Actinomycetota bacterium]
MASSRPRLRVLDFGTVSPLRSQTLWHALGYGETGSAATLSFARPQSPYVCLGLHRNAEELDSVAVDRYQLPVYRRMVGGGPVYLDPDQLFFQISLPVSQVPPRRSQALAELLAPAVRALVRLGVPAVLDEHGEISVDGRKVCGHGAGQIEDTVLVVGNLITGFDHERAAAVLRVSSPATRAEVLRLMRRYVAATPVDPNAWRQAMVEEYAAQLGADTLPGRLDTDEQAAVHRLDALFTSAEWLQGTPRPAKPVRTIKIRAGVWVHEWDHPDACTVLSIADGKVDNVLVEPRGDRTPTPALTSLVGAAVDDARTALSAAATAPLAAALAATQPGQVSA